MIRLVIASLFLLFAVFIFVSEVIGFFKFRYVMNRMHAAGLGDTLGIASVVIAVAVLMGLTMSTIKLIIIVLFMFLTGPVVTHLLAQVEVQTNKNAGKEYTEEDRG